MTFQMKYYLNFKIREINVYVFIVGRFNKMASHFILSLRLLNRSIEEDQWSDLEAHRIKICYIFRGFTSRMQVHSSKKSSKYLKLDASERYLFYLIIEKQTPFIFIELPCIVIQLMFKLVLTNTNNGMLDKIRPIKIASKSFHQVVSINPNFQFSIMFFITKALYL